MSKNKRFADAFYYLKEKGIFKTQKEAASMMICSRSNMSSALKGDEKVLTDSFLIRFAKAFPQISLGWLLAGEGEMLMTEDTAIKDAVPSKKVSLSLYTATKSGMEFYQREDGSLVMKAPLVPQSVLASMPGECDCNLYEDYGSEFFPVDSVYHGRYYAFRVNGDSMDDGTRNGFESGDIVLVRELPKDEWAPRLHLKQWPFWVIAFGNNVRIKQIIRQDENTGDITLHSLNPSPEYTDFTLKLDDIQHLYNIIQVLPHPRKF